MFKQIFAFFFIQYLFSCQKIEDFRENDTSYNQEGYFIKNSILKSQLNDIFIEKPKKIVQISDFFVDGSYMYVGENLKGIHIFKSPESIKPEPFLFLNVPAMRKFTVKDGNLICDNGKDLISYRISGLNNLDLNSSSSIAVLKDPTKFGVVNRKLNLFNYPNYPLERGIYFQCPDSVDFVIEWEKRTIAQKLNCYR